MYILYLRNKMHEMLFKNILVCILLFRSHITTDTFFFLFFASQVSTVLYNMYIVHTLLYVQYKICILPSIESNLSCMIASLAPKSSSHKAGRFPSRVCWAEQKVALSLLALKSKFMNIIRKYNKFIILNNITVHYSSSLGISFILMSPY